MGPGGVACGSCVGIVRTGVADELRGLPVMCGSYVLYGAVQGCDVRMELCVVLLVLMYLGYIGAIRMIRVDVLSVGGG
jgi:hypothetical protein